MKHPWIKRAFALLLAAFCAGCLAACANRVDAPGPLGPTEPVATNEPGPLSPTEPAGTDEPDPLGPTEPAGTDAPGPLSPTEPVVFEEAALDPFPVFEKPVIYLYPEEETQVSVKLDYAGRLTCAYPAYDGGWTVAASPDGTLTDAAGQTYSYLYWEGVDGVEYDFSEGFCVAGGDTAAFLEDALARLGLTRREANEFIVYWLPQMQENPYNLIAFQGDAYTEAARLSIEPAPDTLLRVFMAWKGLDSAVDIPGQTLAAPERVGFTVVEWGGSRAQ